MNRRDFIEHILSTELFRGLPKDDMEALMQFAEPKSFEAGSKIVSENEAGDAFFYVAVGRLEVQISHSQAQGKIMVKQIKPGEIFGEMALLGIEKRTASVVARDPANLFIWKVQDCFQLFEKNKSLGFTVMKNLASILGGRVRDMNLLLRNYAEVLGPEATKYL